jgi:uncharacterized membrane protein YraQ (UPF0718 family)
MNRIIVVSIICVLVIGVIIGFMVLMQIGKNPNQPLKFEFITKEKLLNSSNPQDMDLGKGVQNVDNDISDLKQISNKSLTNYSNNLEKIRQDLQRNEF